MLNVARWTIIAMMKIPQPPSTSIFSIASSLQVLSVRTKMPVAARISLLLCSQIGELKSQ